MKKVVVCTLQLAEGTMKLAEEYAQTITEADSPAQQASTAIVLHLKVQDQKDCLVQICHWQRG